MDVPDVQLVVQWKATCSLAALWQRFGRGGHDQACRATAVILVEKEHFDQERKNKEAQKKTKAEAQSKRKASKQNTAPTPAKQRQIEVDSNLMPNHPTVEMDIAKDLCGSQSEDSDACAANNEADSIPIVVPEIQATMIEELQAKYQDKGRPAPKKKIKVLEPAMDDFINAGVRGLRCHHVPLNAYFENSKACM